MTKRRRRSRGVAAPAAALPAGRNVTQPFNRVVWPTPGGAGALVYDPWTAIRIPAVSRATAVYSSSIKQAPIDAFRGIEPLARPALLDQPDPEQGRAWFVQVHIEDYLWNGNAVHYITAFDAAGWPAAVSWLPASWVTVAIPLRRYDMPTYMIDGVELDRDRVVHVKRGADRWCPARGVGVVEQHMGTLDRIALEEEYERDALRNGAVPSAAVITPNPRLGDDESKQAKVDWLAKFAGPGREPAILPAGTQVIPLAWSPKDAEMTAARQMSLLDIANIFNLDGYWLGTQGGSMTYRSPGAMYTNLLRVSLEGVLADFEDMWSAAWLPRGQRLRFDRGQMTRDDLTTTIQALVVATSADPPLLTIEEARAYLALPITPGIVNTSPLDTPADPGADDQPAPSVEEE